MIAKLITAALLTLSVACTSERPKCESYRVSPEYAGAATEAFAKWSAFSGHTVTVSNDSVCEVRTATAIEYEIFRAKMGIDFQAVHDPDTGNILMAPQMWDSDEDPYAVTRSILMHEIAHEYGLQHVEDPAAVMGTTNPHPRTEYNASDRAELDAKN